MGLPPEEIEAAAAWLAAEAEPEGFEVYPENWQSLEVFLALGTQWNWVAGFSAAVRSGLRYEAITPLFLESLGVRKRTRPQVLGDVRAMERAALEVFQAQG